MIGPVLGGSLSQPVNNARPAFIGHLGMRHGENRRRQVYVASNAKSWEDSFNGAVTGVSMKIFVPLAYNPGVVTYAKSRQNASLLDI